MTKNEVLSLLQRSAISRVVMEYDGSGDEGLVDSVTCFGADDKEVQTTPDTISALEDLVCDILNEQQGGWELDEGSFGKVEIELATGVARFSHNRRVINYLDETFEASIQEGD
jgi:hypothetical protein